MMRTMLLLLLSALCLHAAQIDWMLSYEEAQKVAKEKKRPMLIFMSRANCRAAEYMKGSVFTDDGVAAYMERYYVPVSLNLVNADVPRHLKAASSPVIHFVSEEGVKVHDSLTGSKRPAPFILELRKGVKGYNALKKE